MTADDRTTTREWARRVRANVNDARGDTPPDYRHKRPPLVLIITLPAVLLLGLVLVAVGVHLSCLCLSARWPWCSRRLSADHRTTTNSAGSPAGRSRLPGAVYRHIHCGKSDADRPYRSDNASQPERRQAAAIWTMGGMQRARVALLVLIMALSACSASASSSLPFPTKVCGRDLGRNWNGWVVDLSHGAPGTLQYSDSEVAAFIRVSDNCSHGAHVTWRPSSATEPLAVARAADGLPVVIALATPRGYQPFTVVRQGPGLTVRVRIS
jgi:hypothetical protein